jgi:ubiquinone/menaquinone biosynthesis C-methylase UbiE
MAAMMNAGSLMFMTSIGHQTGLFDAMAGLPACTSWQIADAAGLDERYVREWLAAMVVGRIVDYDSAAQTYALPAEHAAWLTRAAGPANMASPMVLLTDAARVEQEVVRCFREGGGVPYSAYDRFHALMAETSGRRFDHALLSEVLPMSGVVERLQQGIDVADVGCGSGHAINIMARAFPNSRFVGYDFGAEVIEAATAETSALGLQNASFVERDAAHLGETEAFDFVTAFDAIHDQARPDLVLKGIYDALRPGGTFLCVDVAASSRLEENMDHPVAAFLYTISTMHCMTVSLALDGMGLGTMWGEQRALEMMQDAGFDDVEVRRLPSDRFNNYYVAMKEL